MSMIIFNLAVPLLSLLVGVAFVSAPIAVVKVREAPVGVVERDVRPDQQAPAEPAAPVEEAVPEEPDAEKE